MSPLFAYLVSGTSAMALLPAGDVIFNEAPDVGNTRPSSGRCSPSFTRELDEPIPCEPRRPPNCTASEPLAPHFDSGRSQKRERHARRVGNVKTHDRPF